MIDRGVDLAYCPSHCRQLYQQHLSPPPPGSQPSVSSARTLASISLRRNSASYWPRTEGAKPIVNVHGPLLGLIRSILTRTRKGVHDAASDSLLRLKECLYTTRLFNVRYPIPMAQSRHSIFGKSFGCRQAYESRRGTNPRTAREVYGDFDFGPAVERARGLVGRVSVDRDRRHRRVIKLVRR
jgi:hypothetical protein